MHFKSANSIEKLILMPRIKLICGGSMDLVCNFAARYFHQVCPKFCLLIDFTIFKLIVMDEVATTAQGGLFSPHTMDVTSKSRMFMKFEAKILWT